MTSPNPPSPNFLNAILELEEVVFPAQDDLPFPLGQDLGIPSLNLETPHARISQPRTCFIGSLQQPALCSSPCEMSAWTISTLVLDTYRPHTYHHQNHHLYLCQLTLLTLPRCDEFFSLFSVDFFRSSVQTPPPVPQRSLTAPPTEERAIQIPGPTRARIE